MTQFDITYTDFKHEDTTNDITIKLYADNKRPIIPDASHTWKAKVAKEDKYVGEYPVTIFGNTLKLSSSNLTKLPDGNYSLELWETYDGSTAIYPSVGVMEFRVHKNIDDTLGTIDPTTDINAIIDDLHKAGQNIKVVATNTLPAGSKASVTQSITNGENQLTFYIPQGEKGDKGDVGPAPTLKIGTVTKLAPNQMPTANLSGGNGSYTLDLGIPQGGSSSGKGDVGPAPTLKIGTVTKLNPDQTPTASLSGGNGSYTLNLGIPQGERGENGNDGATGPQGKSAYQVWLDNEHTGSETDFLNSLKGKDGKDVDPSLYLSKEEAQKDYATKDSVKTITLDIAKRTLTIGDQVINIPDNIDLTNYYTKSEVDQRLAKAVSGGKVNLSGYLTAEDAGKTYQTKEDAYTQNSNLQSEIAKKADVAVLDNYVPKSQIDTLKGPKGDPGSQGPTGKDGKSAYQVWLDAGNKGTETDFINSLKGKTPVRGIDYWNPADQDTIKQWVDDAILNGKW